MELQKFELKSKIDNINISTKDLLIKLNELKNQNARFLTITTLDHGDAVELIYNFEIGIDVLNIHLRILKKDLIPSITSVFPAAFIAENEVQDHFKVQFSGINIDLGGKLVIPENSPMNLLKPEEGPEPPIMRFFGRCREQCPSMVNAPKYIREIAKGDPVAAYNTVLENAALPACLGRVCFAPCQEGCRQERNDEPIQIRLLKRYAADNTPSLKSKFKRSKLTGKKIAVIGGGPSGVACSFYLGLMGYSVTLYEKNERCGGAMLWGIPKYRLPKNVLELEIQTRLDEAGVILKTNTEITDLKPLLKEYDAIYIALGASGSSKLMIEGENTPGVYDFRDILHSVNVENKTPDLGKVVAVIGGGNSSIDAARVSKRLGAESVTMYYRRTEKEMPASPHEIQGATVEGVNFEYLVTPIKIIPGKPLKLMLQNMKLGEPDSSGRRRPEPILGSEFIVDVDSIITAIGQTVSTPPNYGLEVTRYGTIVVNDDYETSLKGVYAGGDVVFGPKSVIEALRDGKKAASIIDKSFNGEGWPEPELSMDEFVARPYNLEEIKMQEKVDCRELSPEVRITNFDEVELGFDREEALREANRCWRCDWNE
ncbi:FAD-dependent oxidoreductase [Candidatus Bathyarchaeota archaeon]|nr:FAD-dependent oxidoreductase [Candidatus Bathyarchaeota archaeon]